MHAHSFFPRTELYGKKQHHLHQMLSTIGRKCTADLPEQVRNGAHLLRTPERIVEKSDIKPIFDELAHSHHLTRPHAGKMIIMSFLLWLVSVFGHT